jgi:hypothetical protein
MWPPPYRCVLPPAKHLLHPALAAYVCRLAWHFGSEIAVDQAVPLRMQGAVAHIPKKWANVQALFLKTADSVALPIYQTLPGGQQKIAAS